MPTFTVLLFAAALLALAAMVPGCGESEFAPTRGIPIPRIPGPENTMKFWADAYERGDIEKYSVCLAECFSHSFSAGSVNGPDSTVLLGRDDDLAAAARLFEHPCVSSVTMDLAVEGGPRPTEGGLLYRLAPDIRVAVGDAPPPGVTTLSWGQLKQMLTGEGLPCDPAVYRVNSTVLDVEFVRAPDSEVWWLISDMAERLP